MLPRFLVPSADATGDVVPLPDDEAAHLTRVLRLSDGARVRVFDGCGREWEADVVSTARGQASVRLAEAVAPVAEPRVSIDLALAVLKGDKMDNVIRDAVMMGVARITPLVTTRTEISAAALRKSQRRLRWHRIAVSSVKQCGRAVLPAIDDPLTLEAWLTMPRSRATAMLVEPAAAPQSVVALRTIPATDAIALLVGPEGGWTAEEVAAGSRAGCMLVTLAAGTLRADAVPVVAIAALRAAWHDL